MTMAALTSAGRWVLDFALPPRCAGCGEIIGDVHGFCGDCWPRLEFLGASGCLVCGIPLEATEAGQCGACLADPPVVARTRAAVAYGDIFGEMVALSLELGFKVRVLGA